MSILLLVFVALAILARPSLGSRSSDCFSADDGSKLEVTVPFHPIPREFRFRPWYEGGRWFADPHFSTSRTKIESESDGVRKKFCRSKSNLGFAESLQGEHLAFRLAPDDHQFQVAIPLPNVLQRNAFVPLGRYGDTLFVFYALSAEDMDKNGAVAALKFPFTNNDVEVYLETSAASWVKLQTDLEEISDEGVRLLCDSKHKSSRRFVEFLKGSPCP